MSVILIDFFTGRWLSSCLDVGQTGSSNAMIAGKISQQLITCHFPRGGGGAATGGFMRKGEGVASGHLKQKGK